MILNCSVSSAAPATTNVIMGYYGINNYYLDLTTTSTEDKKIVTDFLSVIGKHIYVDILNVPISDYVDTTVIIPEAADLESTEIDYNTLTVDKKTKIDLYISLIQSISTTS
jgi:hypothetical protein